MSDSEKAKQKRTLSRQDRQMAADIAAWEGILNRVVSEDAFVQALANRGYNSERLQMMLKQREDAEVAYENRERAMQARDKATERKHELLGEMKQQHVDFRQILRRPFRDKELRQALFLNGRMPTDMTLYAARARAAYELLLSQELYLKKAARWGYARAQINELLNRLDHLQSILTVQEKARDVVKQMLTVRNTRYTALREEMLQFLAVARIVARKNPTWKALLKR